MTHEACQRQADNTGAAQRVHLLRGNTMTDGRANNGGKRRKHCPRKMTHDQSREALELIRQGTPDKVLARRYGCSRETVINSVERLGVPVPRRRFK